MKRQHLDWHAVGQHLMQQATGGSALWQLNEGQQASLIAISERLSANGLIIADEVGMGKTRIAAALASSVIHAGGRVAILIPPGLGFQWQEELRFGGVAVPNILRSLWQYLAAWENPDPQQQSPWFGESAVLISHAFCNWRLGESSNPWRWALLPELYARWRKLTRGSLPRGYSDYEHGALKDHWVRAAAASISHYVSTLPVSAIPYQVLQDLAESTPWPAALDAVAYRSHNALRPWLERAVGLGLGAFDLIIIDEAHKSRDNESSLSRLLNNVVLANHGERRVALTATPVELNAGQWIQMLGRIQAATVDQDIAGIVTRYAEAVGQIRQSPSAEVSRQRYFEAASRFQAALSPFLLRRDKREDPSVAKFAEHSGTSLHSYRQESEIAVETEHLSPGWKQAVCAAEALSFVTTLQEHSTAKRLRLTMGNGHGISSLLQADPASVEEVAEPHADDPAPQAPQPQRRQSKREKRIEWWTTVIRQSLGEEDAPLYQHPAILAAVQAIEETCASGEKVLVFGRFTEPLRALERLLNARQLLRCIDNNLFWPQAKIHDGPQGREWPAIVAAHAQLGRVGSVDCAAIDRKLGEQYERLTQQREKYRRELLNKIGGGLPMIGNPRAQGVYSALCAMAGDESGPSDGVVAVLAKAMVELTGPEPDQASAVFANAFVDLINAATDRDEGDDDGDGKLDTAEAARLCDTIFGRLKEEYNRPEGGFARFMFGETRPETRRLLQLAFNRRHSFPRVLIAQSTVGREGLNLHKACRTVVLLHPEWNPGVVEQQIGRVDRVGSFWEGLLDRAIEQGVATEDLPRIQVRPVIFRGTYDEKNWAVLRARWDELRAQLHGVVISPALAEQAGLDKTLIDSINNRAPRFSPVTKQV